MRLYSMIRSGLSEEMYALSALLIMATAAALGVHRRLMRRSQEGRGSVGL